MTNTTRKNTGKVKKTVSAALAALMLTTTAASIGASASYAQAPKAATTAEQFISKQFEGKKYKDVLDVWQKAQKGADNVFPQGCDLDGDGIETEEEKNEVEDKLKEYAAGLLVGMMKMGLNKCCDGLADCFDGPMKDLANEIMGIPPEASNNDIIDKIDQSTQQVLGRIADAENNIADKVNDLSVAGSHGTNIDNYASSAQNYRDEIEIALKARTNDEKTVEVAYALGDLGKWSNQDIVKERGRARESFISKFSAKDFNNGNNLYKAAFQATLDKGSLFMKEAVENTQRYIVGCTDKYLQSSITLLEMLTAMDDVSKLTPEQVSKLSASSLENYNKIKNNADKAPEYIALVLDDLFGDNGVITQSAAYVDRKNTEPTTYVGRGMGKFIKLKDEVSVSSDLGFIEPRDKIWFGLGKSKWYWKNGSDTTRLNYSGLTYKEYEGIGKHAFATGYNIENYLKANGFTVQKAYKDSYKNIVLPTAHFDEYHGTAFKGYYSHEGFNGYDITKGYSKNADAPKWNLLHKIQKGGMWMDIPEFNRENLGYGFLFFEKA